MDHRQIEYDNLKNKWVGIQDKCSAMCLTEWSSENEISVCHEYCVCFGYDHCAAC
jgi:hypothetical protein